MNRTTDRLYRFPYLLLLLASVTACSPSRGAADAPKPVVGELPAALPSKALARATFAGGCFWCMEPPFEGLVGVVDVVSGYSGGSEKNPTYKQVSAGQTGHAESVQITYAPAAIRYEQLLQVFLRSMDPTDAGGQFADRGRQYRPAIFTHTAEQAAAAKRALVELGKSERFGKALAVEVTPYQHFYPAEDYHQDYYRTHPREYKRYRRASGREAFLRNVWGTDHPHVAARYDKPDDQTLRSQLSEQQYSVTQQQDTEAPFKNAYWDEKAEGVYVDVVSGQPLFSSTHKFRSGTGWPSFTQPISANSVVYNTDNDLGYERVEVSSKYGGSHLGHVFRDGPQPTGLRYCMNSAALRFVPKEQLQAEGLGYLRPLFSAPTAGASSALAAPVKQSK